MSIVRRERLWHVCNPCRRLRQLCCRAGAIRPLPPDAGTVAAARLKGDALSIARPLREGVVASEREAASGARFIEPVDPYLRFFAFVDGEGDPRSVRRHPGMAISALRNVQDLRGARAIEDRNLHQ